MNAKYVVEGQTRSLPGIMVMAERRNFSLKVRSTIQCYLSLPLKFVMDP